MKTRLGCASALCAALLAVSCSKGESPPAEAPQPPADPVGPAPPAFQFLTRTDATSLALKDVYVAYVTAPATGAEYQALHQRRATALQYLASHAEEAAELVTSELGAGSTGEHTWLAGLHLVGFLDSQTGVQFLAEAASRPLPPPGELRERAGVVRAAAFVALQGRARAGDITARRHLLDLVGSADRDASVLAIRAYYGSGEPRWRAKRSMAARLAPADRYLLNENY